jgi:DNA mismatch repair protein MutL
VIRILDEATIGQIAAGEVVERPASVVKELVENALDAGATTVAVRVARGGLDLIDVRDDGAGIACDDLRLAPRRHATSKLADAAGLSGVATLGFRGEGLASIAAVSRLRITSRVQSSEVGYAVVARGESVGDPEPVAAPPGTRVQAEDLFADVPVRREFLSSPAAEFSRISTLLATLSLAYPAVRFSLEHDGREVWTLPAGGSLDQRLAHVFGMAAARELVALDQNGVAGAVAVRGFVSRPAFDRPDRRMQLLFVNRRFLRTTLLAGAWSAGYSTFTMAGRQPYGVLFLTIAPDRVDPNVHPTKSDVRLRDGTAVGDAVRRAIARTLRREAVDAALQALAPASRGVEHAESGVSFAPGSGAPAVAERFAYAPQERAGERELRVLAQLDDAFILATDGYALVLVDQHAAHERIAFEAIARRAEGASPTEPLLVPYTIELDAARCERFEAARGALAEAGLEAEPFGDRAYRVLATPAGYGARSFDVLGFLDDLADDPGGLDARSRIWASLACHSVVRAGDALEHAEMSALLARLVRCENPGHCPHGRPTIVRMEPDAIARMFKRS